MNEASTSNTQHPSREAGQASSANAIRPIPVLGIPTLVRTDLLRRLLKSIDYPVEQLVIVNNGREYFGTENVTTAMGVENAIRFLVKQPIIIKPGANAGVAQSWNEIIKLFPAPWWMIANDDIEFAPGDLQRMAEDAFQCGMRNAECGVEKPEKPVGMLYGHAASWFAITQRGVMEVGLFDENIYPAYLEDCDWARRCDLLGVIRRNVAGTHSKHGDVSNAEWSGAGLAGVRSAESEFRVGGERTRNGSCTVNSDPVLARHSSRTHQNNFQYYEAKWGGKNGAEIYKTPFDVPGWPVWAWRFEPEFRRLQQWENHEL